MPLPFLAAAGISGAASLLGGAMQASGSRSAARMAERQQAVNRDAAQPFAQAGYGAQARLSQLLGIAPQTAGGGTVGVGGTPFNENDHTWLQQNWEKIRHSNGRLGQGEYSWWNDEANLSPEAKKFIESGVLGQAGVGGAARFGDVNWDTVGGGPQYAQAAGDPSGGDPAYGSLLSPFDAQAFEQYKDPGYQFRLQQGEQALLNKAAAGSGAFSGATLKDLLGFNQDMASTEYSNAFNRYRAQQGDIFGRLSGVAGTGQNAAAGVGSLNTNLTGTAANATQAAGTAMGGGIVGAGNVAGDAMLNQWLYPQIIKAGA